MTKFQSPTVVRFLSDFTLGFADGLTVPFALTAGLSSLGRTDTVIYAGLAELCAGSISMGIGGYLSARDELCSASHRDPGAENGDEEEGAAMLGTEDRSSDGSSRRSFDEKTTKDDAEHLIRKHLEPLRLDTSTLAQVISSLHGQNGGMNETARRIKSHFHHDTQTSSLPLREPPTLPSPYVSGLSISLGYVLGGIIPLFPYFFASTVGMGLIWSAILCLLALFSYGSGKSFFLNQQSTMRWRKMIMEGLQMMVLGSLAATAAVLCVVLVGGLDTEPNG